MKLKALEALTDFLEGCEAESVRQLFNESSAEGREFHRGLLAAYRNVSAFVRNSQEG